MKKLCALVLCCILSLSLVPQAFADAVVIDQPLSAGFTDLTGVTGDALEAVHFCFDHGFVKGFSPTRFGPSESLTRGQFAIVWGRVMQLRQHTFADVPKLKNWDDAVINVLFALGVVKGASTTRFDAASAVTREQVAVMVARCYDLAATNKDAYKAFGDNADIADWAQASVSACLRYNLFPFATTDFKPQQAITRAELCRVIYELHTYKITIGAMTDGAVTANVRRAAPGDTVSLTVAPESGKRLKADSLKFNTTKVTGTTFVMPAEDVTITAEFEAIPPALSSIAITAPPTKLTYVRDETLDKTGLVVTATYEGGSTADVTSGTTATPTTLDVVNPAQVITLSYSEGGVTKTATFTVEVTAP